MSPRRPQKASGAGVAQDGLGLVGVAAVRPMQRERRRVVSRWPVGATGAHQDAGRGRQALHRDVAPAQAAEMAKDLVQAVAAMDDEQGACRFRGAPSPPPASAPGRRWIRRSPAPWTDRARGRRPRRRDRAGWSRHGRSGRDRPAAAGRGRERPFVTRSAMPLRLAFRSASSARAGCSSMPTTLQPASRAARQRPTAPTPAPRSRMRCAGRGIDGGRQQHGIDGDAIAAGGL